MLTLRDRVVCCNRVSRCLGGTPHDTAVTTNQARPQAFTFPLSYSKSICTSPTPYHVPPRHRHHRRFQNARFFFSRVNTTTGGTSSVRLLKRRGTQDVYVAKVFNTLHQEQSELLCAELRALVVMDCPCVVGFHGVSDA